MLPSEAGRLLGNVPEQFTFRCNDGTVLWNPRDLSDAVGNMPDEVFSSHVNRQKNDFANWVRDVIGDHALARDLLQTRYVATTRRHLTERVAFLDARRGWTQVRATFSEPKGRMRPGRESLDARRRASPWRNAPPSRCVPLIGDSWIVASLVTGFGECLAFHHVRSLAWRPILPTPCLSLKPPGTKSVRTHRERARRRQSPECPG